MALATANTPAKDNRLAKYLREVRAELRKVQWPNRKELITYTNVTLLTVAVVAVFIFLIDLVFSGVLNVITGLGR